MTLAVAADVELLVVNWLRTVDELDGVAIHTAFGPEQEWPAVRVTRLGGSRPWPSWVDTARLQIEGWSARVEDGGSKAEALEVVELALAALTGGLAGTHAEGVVTAALIGLAPTWAPDQTTDQPRYVADMLITSHPNTDQGGS